MNGKLRVCRKCLPGQNNEETFYEDLSRYIQRMDEDLKVDQQIYEKRLNICSTCDRLMKWDVQALRMLCGTACCTEGAKMSGSSGKMGGAEMRRWFKRRVIK